jgi:hypothetical protein
MCYQDYNNKLKAKCPCAYNKYFSLLNMLIIVCKKHRVTIGELTIDRKNDIKKTH